MSKIVPEGNRTLVVFSKDGEELKTKISDFIWHPRSRYLEIGNILDTVYVFIQEL